jgi:hypothetical protein
VNIRTKYLDYTGAYYKLLEYVFKVLSNGFPAGRVFDFVKRFAGDGQWEFFTRGAMADSFDDMRDATLMLAEDYQNSDSEEELEGEIREFLFKQIGLTQILSKVSDLVGQAMVVKYDSDDDRSLLFKKAQSVVMPSIEEIESHVEGVDIRSILSDDKSSVVDISLASMIAFNATVFGINIGAIKIGETASEVVPGILDILKTKDDLPLNIQRKVNRIIKLTDGKVSDGGA